MDATEQRALVLFSGGQDSATCLAWALGAFDHVETVGFNYGQRHLVELEQRPAIIAALRAACPTLAARLGDDTVLDVPTITQLGHTAMTDDVEIQMDANGLPNTFVPARNLLFLTFAAALAYRWHSDACPATAARARAAASRMRVRVMRQARHQAHRHWRV